MKTIITQKQVAKILNTDTAFICRLLNGKLKPTTNKAAKFEQITGIDRMIWLYAAPEILRQELERVYGNINDRRGRPRKHSGSQLNDRSGQEA